MKKTTKLTPANFTREPIGSISRSAEQETAAKNIMIILARTGNTFRKLSFEEFKSERMKDKKFYKEEERYFNNVVEYCVSSEKALEFCSSWNL